ncbi:TCP-1/cpn60 chaperonin family-domain-containing protein [Boletus reticuloceps]|uniref:TCP-1/cpn60 chaperonin family-domain-containing protein n=1 Tax=Boletus reticuloceps TaxID=495285 RepID=A0A8I2YEE5_9AGAM|nr:TCP-1/cpn60 chaperonin family-domain-containing protein [Boletus reticuloceps]
MSSSLRRASQVDTAQHVFERAKVSAIRRVRESDNNHVEDLRESDVGTGCRPFHIEKIGGEYFTFLTACTNPKACTILLRGPSKNILNEINRNLADALSVMRNMYFDPILAPGGGATEMAISIGLHAKARSVWTVLVDGPTTRLADSILVGTAASGLRSRLAGIGRLCTTLMSLAAHPLQTPLDPAKYVPYTPRQRQPTTTSAKPHQATLRSLALHPTAIGWAILATLLLPAESTLDPITVEFVQDHLVLCDLASRQNTAVVSLSGLRGHILNDLLTFRSTLHRSINAFHGLWSPSASRPASLDALPPLPSLPTESSYPSFAVSAFTATIPPPFERRNRPYSPTPSWRPWCLSILFSPPIHVLCISLWPETFHPPSLIPTTATTSADIDSTIDISAIVIDTDISRSEIATGIISALKGEITIALNDQPPWDRRTRTHDISGNPNRIVYAVNGALDQPDELADKFQVFYRTVESELRNGGHAQADGPDVEPAPVQVDEAQIRDILETIEATSSALNMLDLGLEHLDADIDIGDANHEAVDAVVRACGQSIWISPFAHPARRRLFWSLPIHLSLVMRRLHDAFVSREMRIFTFLTTRINSKACMIDGNLADALFVARSMYFNLIGN